MVNIGQVRRYFFSNYLAETGNGTPSIVHPERRDANNNVYIDTAINCGALDSTKTYYLKARLEKNDDPFQKINIRLRYSNDISGSGDNVYQNLKAVTLDTGSASQQVEIMFTPNANYNLISFELVRTADDSMPNGNGNAIGRIVEINQDIDFREVVNLIPSIASIYDGLVTLKQIGVRSEPGLRMCINGEEIFVGPSGVYEIYNGMQIKYLGFVINDSKTTSDKKSDFIVDFTY